MSTATQWTAIVNRDAHADAHFIYAVRTTGIYCRPSCPSRRPDRRNVVFFDTPAEARAGGFRACKRCRPDERPAADPWVEKIGRACALLAQAEHPPSLHALASRFAASAAHFQRMFTRIVGVSPRAYAEAHRAHRVKSGLRRSPTVTDALFDAGYQSSSRFYEGVVKRIGMAPSVYRRGGAGEVIRYTTVRSDLGWVLIAMTARGLCAVSMGDSADRLKAALEREYPAAVLERSSAGLAEMARTIVGLVDGHPPSSDLPFDVRATAFQWRVWSALSKIPAGETRTYGELAAAIGRPRAARAVARACASNRLALAIPCHRAVPASGGAGGYRWGASRKQALLAREGKMPGRD
jgi:AraC family transcriptional regulator of adaptative response/methylated-DNA-[protein]-cysteine methyltransferase